MVRVDGSTLQWEVVDLGDRLADSVAYALGIDFFRQVWVLVPAIPGAIVYELETQEITFALDDCGQDVCHNGAAYGGDVWTTLRATARIPRGSRVTLMVRTGADDADLWDGDWLLAGQLADGDNELDLSPVLGESMRLERTLALQARLEADRGAASPILTSVELSWGCRRVE